MYLNRAIKRLSNKIINIRFFSLFQEIRKGLLKAAKTTGAWIFTGGTNTGEFKIIIINIYQSITNILPFNIIKKRPMKIAWIFHIRRLYVNLHIHPIQIVDRNVLFTENIVHILSNEMHINCFTVVYSIQHTSFHSHNEVMQIEIHRKRILVSCLWQIRIK